MKDIEQEQFDTNVYAERAQLEQIITSPALAPVHRWTGLLKREYSEPPWGLEPHSHPLTEGSKGCGACQATLL